MQRKYLIIIILAVLAVGGICTALALNGRQTEQQDLLQAAVVWAADEDGQCRSLTVDANSSWKRVYPDKIQLRDTGDATHTIGADSFIRYVTGDVASFQDGVLTDTAAFVRGFTTTYHIPACSAVQLQGESYLLTCNAAPIEVSSFIWRLETEKYLIAGDRITLQLPDGTTRTTENPVELTWLEAGIVRTVVDGEVFLTVTSNYTIGWDGCVLNMAEQTLYDTSGARSLPIASLTRTMEGLISTEQQPAQKKHPTWNFTLIDGIDGEDGVDGERGGKGLPGKIGMAGMMGPDGGTGGQGKDGKIGLDESTKDERLLDTALTNLDYTVTETGFSASATLKLGSWKLKNYTVRILNASGVCVAEWPAGTGSAALSVTLREDSQQNKDETINVATFDPITVSGLTPDTQYELRITADYYNELDQLQGSRIFVSRSFYTDTQGIRLQLKERSETSVTYTVTRKTGTQAVVIQCGPAGQPPVTDKDVFSSEGAALAAEVTFDNLTPNTEYDLQVITDNRAGEKLSVCTLRRMPDFGAVVVGLDAGTCQLGVADVNDPDNSIIDYTYHIIAADPNEPLLMDQLHKQKSTSNPNGQTSLVFDGTDLRHGLQYTAKAFITCYDNEKAVTFEAVMKDSPDTATIDESVFSQNKITSPVMTVEPTILGPNDFTGAIRLQYYTALRGADGSLLDQYQVMWGYTNQNPMYVVVYTTRGKYSEPHTFVYPYNNSTLLGYTGQDAVEMINSYDAAGNPVTVLTLGLQLSELTPGTQYTVQLYGDFVDLARLQAGFANSAGFGMLGQAIFTTP